MHTIQGSWVTAGPAFWRGTEGVVAESARALRRERSGPHVGKGERPALGHAMQPPVAPAIPIRTIGPEPEFSVLRRQFEQAPGAVVLVVLENPDHAARALDDASNPRTHVVTLDLAGTVAVEIDPHDRLR